MQATFCTLSYQKPDICATMPAVLNLDHPGFLFAFFAWKEPFYVGQIENCFSSAPNLE
jgi:hypothetical protein